MADTDGRASVATKASAAVQMEASVVRAASSAAVSSVAVSSAAVNSVESRTGVERSESATGNQ